MGGFLGVLRSKSATYVRIANDNIKEARAILYKNDLQCQCQSRRSLQDTRFSGRGADSRSGACDGNHQVALHLDESGEFSGLSSCLCDSCHPAVTFPIPNVHGSSDDLTGDDSTHCQVLRVVQRNFGPIYGKVSTRFNAGRQEQACAKENSKADVRNENSCSSILFPSPAKFRPREESVSLGRTNADSPEQSPDYRSEVHRHQQQHVNWVRQTHGCHTDNADPNFRHTHPVARSEASKDTEVKRFAQDSFGQTPQCKQWSWLACIAAFVYYSAQLACSKKNPISPPMLMFHSKYLASVLLIQPAGFLLKVARTYIFLDVRGLPSILYNMYYFQTTDDSPFV